MMNETIHECCAIGNDVNRTPKPIHYAGTYQDAIYYLKKNGGGLYRNALHKFEHKVPGLSLSALLDAPC